MYRGARKALVPRISQRRVGPLLVAITAALLLSLGAVGCGLLPGPPGGEGQEAPAPVTSPVVTGERIEVQARLAFPRRAELTFERAGEVEEVLVSAGDMVTEGQVLARLNSDIFPVLEEELARLRYQIAEAEDAIKLINLDYSGEPLLAAQREENVARLELANTQAQDVLDDIDQNYADRLAAAELEVEQAQSALDAADDTLAEVRRDQEPNHAQALAAAEQAVAGAEVALDQATEQLEDYRSDLSDEAIRAADRVNVAQVALDQATERLDDYREEIDDSTVRSRDRVTEFELALDLANDALEDFLEEHDRRVIRARTAVGAADAALDAARAPLTAFLRNPSRDVEADGRPVDLGRLATLRAAVDLAEANLAKAEQDLAELEAGPDALRVQELESNITVAELNLSDARDDLAELEEGPDPILLQELESSVSVAELNLQTANDDLAELQEGPDILVLNQLQSQVDLARVNLAQANRRLEEEREGPDPLVIPRLEVNQNAAQLRLALAQRDLKELQEEGPNRDAVPVMEREMLSRLAQIDELYRAPDSVKLAQIASLVSQVDLANERMADIWEQMEEYSLVAPSGGMVFLVNVEVDDLVSENSRVIELVDPSHVVVKGFIYAGDAKYVSVGAPARLSIDSMPGQDLRGSVTHLSDLPRTERGVVSYELQIQVDVPEGVRVPPRLSPVDAVLMP